MGAPWAAAAAAEVAAAVEQLRLAVEAAAAGAELHPEVEAAAAEVAGRIDRVEVAAEAEVALLTPVLVSAILAAIRRRETVPVRSTWDVV